MFLTIIIALPIIFSIFFLIGFYSGKRITKKISKEINNPEFYSTVEIKCSYLGCKRGYVLDIDGRRKCPNCNS